MVDSYKDKPRGAIDTRYNLEVAYQEEQSRVSARIEDDSIDSVWDDQVDGEEVDGSSFQFIVNENEDDSIEEGDEEISTKEEKSNEEMSGDEEEGDEETSSDKNKEEENATSEDEHFSDNDDSSDVRCRI